MHDDGGDSLDRRQDRVIEEMGRFGDWMGKYEYLVYLGRKLESSEDLRAEAHLVPGCQSRVWMRARMDGERLRLEGDSDALITRGIVALLLWVLDGHAPEEIAGVELYFLEETGLGSHLSPSRANGLGATVKRIREFADEHTGEGAA